jgi:hypothetical protein
MYPNIFIYTSYMNVRARQEANDKEKDDKYGSQRPQKR